METLQCAAVGTASHQHGLEEFVLCMETLQCAAVGTASHQHGLEESVLCMETLQCSAVGTASCEHVLEELVLFGRLGSMLKNGEVVLYLSALSQLAKKYYFFHLTQLCTTVIGNTATFKF